MNHTLIDDLLTLLAITVMADKRVLAEEIETFMNVGNTVQNDLSLSLKVSSPRLLLWFENHRETLQGILNAPDFEPRFMALLGRLATLPDKSPIFKAMNTIAQADNNVHVSEQALMVLAKRAWG